MFFIDSAELKEIELALEWGIVSGVTTNPTLIRKSGREHKDVIKEICNIVKGPVSAEVISLTSKEMIDEGLRLSEIAQNVVIKLPCTRDGIKAASLLKAHGCKLNITLCFSAAQAILAASVGADYISPFIGRLDDIGHQGVLLIEEIAQLYESKYDTKILAASIRSVEHVLSSFKLGAHVVTAPMKILDQMFDHPLTHKGLEIFIRDYEASQTA
ncbi:fructose-6-phosphate aldolase [Neorickettsia helminthoeca str. Oregon]|uniref:Fructose-6-phosphate aldolase n=1 Tax=Neorickettsia helminthoeca str. Oregon TaxID=1286528 RepID=X5HMG1_9RICK|nr:fructose-6-phosphate aldolase [Neorickettsia helminthoeca]AHX11655.1 fructose-6-phosphate aldolase [Neorickettsia helminthoeca str. Oregon]